MNPYLANQHRDGEFLVPKRDRKGNVVHYRRRWDPKSEKDDNRFFIAIGVIMTVMYAWMILDWINTPL